jgi:hypothetical protein
MVFLTFQVAAYCKQIVPPIKSSRRHLSQQSEFRLKVRDTASD